MKMWNALLDAGAEFGIRPCGLGARNTLRLEAGMSLYGHEISEEINVFEAGLARWLKLDKGDFIGRDALLAVQAAGGPKRKIIGLRNGGAGHRARWVSVLSLEGEPIGKVTSGSPAPFLKTNIAHGAGSRGGRRIGQRCAGRCARESGAGSSGSAAVLQAAEDLIRLFQIIQRNSDSEVR